MSSILITGANRGLGLEFVAQYAAAGWRVLAACRDPSETGALKRIAEAAGGSVSLHRLEVTDPGSIRRLAGELSSQPLDLLLNNAGVAGREAATFGQTDKQAWLDTMAVNVVAPMHMAEAFLPHVQKSERRIIATISSRMGSIGENGDGGMYAYRSSKAAANAVAKSLSNELKDKGVAVVVLHPGWVRTDMGGPDAPVLPQESVSGLKKVLDKVTLADSGKFINYDGSPIPW